MPGPETSERKPTARHERGFLVGTVGKGPRSDSGYRFENGNALRAPSRPYFLRSFIRPSRVSWPSWGIPGPPGGRASLLAGARRLFHCLSRPATPYSTHISSITH